MRERRDPIPGGEPAPDERPPRIDHSGRNDMTRRLTGLSMAVLVLMACAAELTAQEGRPAVAGGEEPLRAEIAALNRSVAKIAALLEEQLKRQQAELLMQRIQLASRGLNDLEQRVRGAKEERESLEREKRLMQEEIARLEVTEDEEPPGLLSRTDDERKAIRSNLERETRRMEEMLVAVDGRLAELEVELGERLDAMDAWEELVDKALGLR